MSDTSRANRSPARVERTQTGNEKNADEVPLPTHVVHEARIRSGNQGGDSPECLWRVYDWFTEITLDLIITQNALWDWVYFVGRHWLGLSELLEQFLHHGCWRNSKLRQNNGKRRLAGAGEGNEDLMFLQTALKCEYNFLEINANEFLTRFVNKLLIQWQLFREFLKTKLC